MERDSILSSISFPLSLQCHAYSSPVNTVTGNCVRG